MNYKEQIKNPLWQRRRLEILNRDNFTCQICGCKDKTLHVHHTAYIKGKMIWEYPDRMLITMCEECHEYEHMCDDAINEELWHLKSRGVTNKEIRDLLQFIDCRIFRGDQNIIENIIGENYDPGIDIPYIRLLAQRREDCTNNNHGNSGPKEDNVI